jgi:hypothetical protein
MSHSSASTVPFLLDNTKVRAKKIVEIKVEMFTQCALKLKILLILELPGVA